MSESTNSKQTPLPEYVSRDNFISAAITVVVMMIAVVIIWQMHSTAMNKIDGMMSESVIAAEDGTVDTTKISALKEVAKTDPVGFDLANYMQANYDKIVLVVYFLLAALTIATIARFLTFFIRSINRSRYYPDNTELKYFMSHDHSKWNDFYDSAMGQNYKTSTFWRILRDSVMVTNASRRYDHLYLHFRNRIDRVSESLSETALYDSIATASPAAGFFGTLVGLLFVFSQTQGYGGSMSQSPAFSIGMKVAIITSLWGLFNLGLAIVCSYFTRKVTDSIHQQMVTRAVAICGIVESLKIPQAMKATDETIEKEKVRVE